MPLDGSALAEQTLPYVSFLAKKMREHVELFRVIEPLPLAGLPDPAYESCRQLILAELNEDAEAYLTGVAARLAWQGIDVSAKVVHGDPASLVLKAVEGQRDVLIAMSTHGRSGITGWVLGSVTDKVLHSTVNPLLIARCRKEVPDPEIKLSTLIVPLDGSALAEQILPHVSGLAEAMKIKIDLVTVIPSAGDAPSLFEIVPMSGEGPAVEVKENATAYLHQVAKKLRREGTVTIEEHVLEGHPAVAIIDYAKGIPDNVVAMASHGRSGIGRWLLGSITDLAARNSGDPVLVVHSCNAEPSKE